MNYEDIIKKRRTFAIVSHPDAGKTTITEKFLWYGNVIREAGSVRAKANKKYTTSDWMEIEKKRGISVSSSALSFPYNGCQINLLDTPGHQDFSEDTYRALMAVDSALVLIDAAKGVEPQTIKLMDACKLRQTPITVFINKMDRDARDCIELMDEVETVLGVRCAPMTLPIGNGPLFQGVYHLGSNTVHFYNPDSEGQKIETVSGIGDQKLDKWFDEKYLKEFRGQAELVMGAVEPLGVKAYLEGKQAPVFFGSALNNFGVKQLLDSFVNIAPMPLKRQAKERLVDPLEASFTGFIFKIQANMDPKHRDRIAFIRACSGSIEKGGRITHCPTGRQVKMTAPSAFMAQDKSTLETVYAGDIIGIHDPGLFSIGDTLSSGDIVNFMGIPDFPAEHFGRAILEDPLKSKKLAKGLAQLSEEGATQLFYPIEYPLPVLGVVGELQFDVIQSRLKGEYDVPIRFDKLGIFCVRWVTGPQPIVQKFRSEHGRDIAKDKKDNLVYLCPNEYRLQLVQKNFPEIKLLAVMRAEGEH